MCLDISDGGEEKCIGRNSWPKCDRCACAAAADGRADFHGDIPFLLYIRIYNIIYIYFKHNIYMYMHTSIYILYGFMQKII